jgi:hypothetical protein
MRGTVDRAFRGFPWFHRLETQWRQGQRQMSSPQTGRHQPPRSPQWLRCLGGARGAIASSDGQPTAKAYCLTAPRLSRKSTDTLESLSSSTKSNGQGAKRSPKGSSRRTIRSEDSHWRVGSQIVDEMGRSVSGRSWVKHQAPRDPRRRPRIRRGRD